MALCSTWPPASIATCQPGRGGPPTHHASPPLESHASSHKSHASSHNPQASSHRSHAASHKSQVTSHKPRGTPRELPADAPWHLRVPGVPSPGTPGALPRHRQLQAEHLRVPTSGTPGALHGELQAEHRESPGASCKPQCHSSSLLSTTHSHTQRHAHIHAQGRTQRYTRQHIGGLPGASPAQAGEPRALAGAPGTNPKNSNPCGPLPDGSWYTPRAPRALRAAQEALGAALVAAAFFLGCPDPSWALASRELAALVASSVPYDEAMENGKPTMLEFYADWCTICNDMAPMLKDVEAEFRGQVNAVMVNIDNPIWAEEVDEFGVEGLPHFSFLDGQGNEEAYMVGRVARSQLKENLQALAQGTAPLPHQFVSEDQSPAEARSVTRVDPRSHSQGS